jgi:putative sporulation protein YtxC
VAADDAKDELKVGLNSNSIIIDEDFQNWIKCDVSQESLESLSKALADFICIKFVPKAMERHILDSDYDLSENERKAIVEASFEASERIRKCADVIKYKIYDYLKFNDTFNIKGFVKFRLKEYFSEMKELVDIAARDYEVEKQYERFIDLLKQYVSIQEPAFEELHFIQVDNGCHRILNSDGEDVTKCCIEELEKEGLGGNDCFEEMMITSLVSLAPKKIYLHRDGSGDTPFVETIKSIFAGRVIMC